MCFEKLARVEAAVAKALGDQFGPQRVQGHRVREPLLSVEVVVVLVEGVVVGGLCVGA